MVWCVNSHLDRGMNLPAFRKNDFSMYTHAFCTNESIVGSDLVNLKTIPQGSCAIDVCYCSERTPLKRDVVEDEVGNADNRLSFDEDPYEDESQAYAVSQIQALDESKRCLRENDHSYDLVTGIRLSCLGATIS